MAAEFGISTGTKTSEYLVDPIRPLRPIFRFQSIVDDFQDHNNSIVQILALEILYLCDLMELKHIWKGATRLVSLCNLNEVEIVRCPHLRCIFSSPSLARSLQQLEILRISNCDDLEEIISWRGGSDDDDFSCCCCFTNLRLLQVHRCPKVRTIFPIERSIGRAPYLYPQSHACRLPKLQEISLLHNQELEHVFGNQIRGGERVECPALQVFVVAGSPKMSTSFFATQLAAPSAKQLRCIEVGNLQGTSLFSMSMARSMVELQVLKISRCDNLTHIISTDEDEGEEIQAFTNKANEAWFPQLQEVEVTECKMISSFFFPLFVACGVSQLQELKVSKVPLSKHVFGNQEEDGDFWLPLLTKLKLKDLPNLISLWEGDRIPSSWPSKYWDSLLLKPQRPPMQVLEVSGCPNFSTYSFANRQSQLRAQAEQKLLKSIGVNNLQRTQYILQLRGQDENQQLYLAGLCLRDVADMECIWKGSPRDINMCFSSLKWVTVTGCNKLKQVFTTTIAKSLAQLELLTIMRCDELEYVVIDEDVEGGDDNEDGHLKSLRILKVIQCEKLKTIFSLCVTHHLPSLEELHLKSNPELMNIFGSGMDTNVQQLSPSTLKVLVVSGCPQISLQFLSQLNNQSQALAKLRTISLEKIPKKEKVIQLQQNDVDKSLTFDLFWLNLYDIQQLQRVWKGPAKNVRFSNLNAIVVKHCNQLECLFTATIARSMLKLRFLTIEQCSNLQHVVIVDQEDNAVHNNNTVLFPELEWLRLKDLPILKSLCPSPAYQLKSHFKEHWLKVEECPQCPQIKEYFRSQQNTEIEATVKNEISIT